MKVFEIKKLPREWKLLELEKIVDFQGGSQPPKDVFITEERDGYIRLVQIRDFRTDKYKTYIPISQAKRFFNEDDIMIGRYGPPVFQILRGLSGSYNVALMKTKPKEILDRNYLFYLLKTPNIQNVIIENSQRTAGQTGVNLDLLNKIIVPLPPLDDQKRVAAVLDKAGEVRSKRQQAIQKLDALLRSVFLDMFGDPVSNPKEWESTKIGEIAPFISSGSTPLGGSATYLSEGILFIRSQNVLMNNFDFSDAAFISDETHSKMKRSWVKNGDVLFNITGASIGRVHHFTGKDDSANVNQHVSIIRPNQNKVRPEFLSRFLSMPSYQAKIMVGNAGATRQAFNFEQIRNFPILLPPIEIQNEFIEVSEKITKIRKKTTESEKENWNLFQSLQERAFVGELFSAKEIES